MSSSSLIVFLGPVHHTIWCTGAVYIRVLGQRERIFNTTDPLVEWIVLSMHIIQNNNHWTLHDARCTMHDVRWPMADGRWPVTAKNRKAIVKHRMLCIHQIGGRKLLLYPFGVELRLQLFGVSLVVSYFQFILLLDVARWSGLILPVFIICVDLFRNSIYIVIRWMFLVHFLLVIWETKCNYCSFFISKLWGVMW